MTNPIEPAAQPFLIRIRAVTTLRVTNLVGSVIIAAAGAFGVWDGFEIGLVTHNGWVIAAVGLTYRQLVEEPMNTNDRRADRALQREALSRP